MHRISSIALLAMSLGLACASAPPPPPPAPAPAPVPHNALQADLVGAPRWVMACASAVQGKKTLICGVGSIAGMSNIGLARSAAEGRGRTEIARSLQLRVKSMLKDYQSATQGGPGGKLSSEQHIEDTAKQVTDLTLNGSRLQDSWISNGGTFYALMVLDVATFKDSLGEMKQLDDKVRAAISERADQAFEQLEEATDAHPPEQASAP
jgi:hypothetical protein